MGRFSQTSHGACQAADEARSFDQVRRPHALRTETQMRDRHRTRLLRVVLEVPLSVAVGIGADDLDAVLIGADGPVCAEADEDSAHLIVGEDVEAMIHLKAEVGQVIIDADGEMAFRRVLAQLIKDGLDHGRREFLG